MRKSDASVSCSGTASVSSLSPLGSYSKIRRMLHAMLPAISQRYQAKFDASDIVQQSLLDACAKAEDYQGTSEKEMAGWLKQILLHNLLDAVRRLRSRKRDIAREQRAHSAGGSISNNAYLFRSDQTSPSQRIAAAEEFQRVQEAIRRLPEAQRTAVTLHHLEGQTLREISVQMNCSRGAVAGLLHRGLRTLQATVGKLK